MGILRESFQVLRSDELKELKRKADAQPRTSLMDGVRMANQAADAAAGWEAYAATGAMYTAGTPGSAKVLALRDTGTFVNGAPVMDIDLEVTVPGRDPYPVTHRQIVAHAALMNFQPGRVWPVKVDASDPTKLVIG